MNIAVNDLNDEYPIFSDDDITVGLAENNQVGAQVASFLVRIFQTRMGQSVNCLCVAFRQRMRIPEPTVLSPTK